MENIRLKISDMVKEYFGSFPSAYPIAENDGLPIRPKGNKRKSIKKRKDWESNLKGYE